MRIANWKVALSMMLFGVALVVSSCLALWDIAHTNMEAHDGYYPFPFVIVVLPWYIAGDFFVSLNYIGLAIFYLGFLGMIDFLPKMGKKGIIKENTEGTEEENSE